MSPGDHRCQHDTLSKYSFDGLIKPGGFMRFMAIFLVFCLMAFQVNAEHGVYGFGAKSCGTFLNEKQNDSLAYRGFTSWLTGYLSGVSFALPEADIPDFTLGADINGSLYWIENYCKQHPASAFDEAAADFVVKQIFEVKPPATLK
jgi:hypothetical protein